MDIELGPVSLVAATIGAGLVAGLFFAFATSVMPGLARTEDSVFVPAMQAMNVAILNPVFLTVFVGPLIAFVVAGIAGPSRAWVIAGGALYLASFVITMVGNVPLNEALEAVGPTRDPAVLEAARTAFEDPWNRLHLIRTAATIGSLACCIAGWWAA